MRADGTFIAIEVDDAVSGDADLARKLTEACPVDIYGQSNGGGLEIVQSHVDECVLCRLCLDVVDGDTNLVKVIKLYDNDAILA